MERCKLFKTKKTYRIPVGLTGVVLDTLESFPELKVVAIKYDVSGWKLSVVAEKDLEYLEDQND